MFSKNETLKAKGIAILLLLFHHLFYDSERIEQSGVQFLIFQQDIVQQIAVAARICVWIFVFLSAYGLTYQYVNRKEDSKCILRSPAVANAFWNGRFAEHNGRPLLVD